MILNRKILGLAFMAVLAVAAMSASAAQAQTPEFHCTSTSVSCFVVSSGGTHGTGSNDNKFTVNGGNVECTGNTTVDGAQFKGTAAKTTSSVQLEATYTGCKAFGVAASVKMEGCKYQFALVAGGGGAVNTNVVCPAGKSITVSAKPALDCVITVGAQGPLTGVSVANAGTEPTHIAATVAIGEVISYTKTGTECPGGAGSGTNGKYAGTATLTGYEDNSEVKGTKVGLHVF
jgi:hypothetical protein